MARERPSVFLQTMPDPAVVGVVYALGAFIVWGLAPIYFKSLGDVRPLDMPSASYYRYINSLPLGPPSAAIT
jgi:EamA domain-containing membrane protein RarD